MEKDQTGSGTPSSQESGAPAADGNDSGSDSRSNRDSGLDNALRDVHKYKTRSKDLEKKVTDLEKLIETQNTKKLQDEKNWEELYKTEKKRAEDSETKYKGFFNDVVKSEKRNAVKTEAIKAGLHNEDDVDFFDYDSLEVEYTTNGRMIVHGANDLVETFKKGKPYLFKTSNPSPINSGGKQGAPPNPTKVTAADVVALKNKHGLDSKEYNDALNAWADSRRKEMKK